MRYTPQGSAVCTFGLATNRTWTTDTGDKQEEAVFHRIVAWSKLAEICSQLLGKGDKVFVEGRLTTRQWEGQDGVSRTTTEITIADMILLKSQKGRDEGGVAPGESQAQESAPAAPAQTAPASPPAPPDDQTAPPVKKGTKKGKEELSDEEIASDDIPF